MAMPEFDNDLSNPFSTAYTPLSLVHTTDKFRKVSLYKDCELQFNTYAKVALCQYAGPVAIATLKDETSDKINIVRTYTAGGEQLGQIEASHIYQIFWTLSLKLVILNRDGRCLVYTATGNLIKQFDMYDKSVTSQVESAKTFVIPTSSSESASPRTGLACLKNNGQLFVVNNVEDPMLWRISEVAARSSLPLVWAIISASSEPLFAWYTPREGFRMCAQGKSVQSRTADWMIMRAGEYVEITQTVNLANTCLLHNTGVVQVASNELDTLLYRIELSDISQKTMSAMRIYWCKDDKVMLRTGKNSITCISVESKPVEYTFNSEVYARAEIDGLHVFTHNAVDAIMPISDAYRHVFSVRGVDPAAQLYEATKKFDARDAAVTELVELIGERLGEAVRDCWTAAIEARDHETRRCFRAAVFGQSLRKFERTEERIEFYKHCNTLRIVAFLRQTGIPISFTQFMDIGVDAIIDRCIEMGRIAAADILARHAAPSARQRIAAMWASSAMDNAQTFNADQNKLAERIIARFAELQDVSFATTAEQAWQKGLQVLAKRLLECESDVKQRVTVYLKLKQFDKALKMSATSTDPDLIYMVIRHLRQIRSEKELELELQRIPHVFAMYKKMARDENPDRMLSLYMQTDDFRQQALYYLSVLPNLSEFDVEQRVKTLDKAGEAFSAANAQYLDKLVQQHKLLVQSNVKMEEKCGTSLTHFNVRESYEWAITQADNSYAEHIRKQHKLSDKQVWTWTVAALAAAEMFDRLEHFVRESRPPSFGYFHLMRVYAAHGQQKRALKFMDRVPQAEQSRAYALLGYALALVLWHTKNVEKAAEVAFARSDFTQLLQLRLQQPQESANYALVNAYIERAQASASTSAQV